MPTTASASSQWYSTPDFGKAAARLSRLKCGCFLEPGKCRMSTRGWFERPMLKMDGDMAVLPLLIVPASPVE
jgi:hypothetical protein